MQTTLSTLATPNNTSTSAIFAPKFPRGFRLTPLSWNGVGNSPEREIIPITQADVLAIRRTM